MKRNKAKGSARKGGKQYWDKMHSAQLFGANIGFMDATVGQPLAFRIRFAWEIVKGINPITAERPGKPKHVR